MRGFKVLLAATLVALQTVGAARTSNFPSDRFLVDKTRPYVYLEFDHVGPRRPTRVGDYPTGLWLHLHNNCILPIIVGTFGHAPDSTPDGEIGLIDNVVKNTINPSGDGEVTSESWPPEPLSPNLGTILGDSSPEGPAKNPSTPANTQTPNVAEMPYGYIFPVHSLTTIAPGQSVYFSVPLNHVGRAWHIEIPFSFPLRQRGPLREPYSYVAFFWVDLPKAERD